MRVDVAPLKDLPAAQPAGLRRPLDPVAAAEHNHAGLYWWKGQRVHFVFGEEDPLHPGLEQFFDAHARIEFRAIDNLLEQVEHGHEPGLGADEGALAETVQPLDCLFGGRSQVIVRLILPRRIVFSKPATLVGSPIVQVGRSTFRIQDLAFRFVKLVQAIVELGRQFLARDRAHVRRNEASVQEAGDHGRMIRREKTPRRM